MRVPSRKRSQNPPKGKRNIIDSKEPDGKGICIPSPFQGTHPKKLTPSSPEKNGSLSGGETRLYQTFLGGPFPPTDSGGFLNHVRMRFGRGFFRADGGLPSPSVFWGGKNRAAQGPLRWNLPKLPPLPGETGRWLEKQWDFPQNEGKKSRHGKRPEENGNWWKWI